MLEYTLYLAFRASSCKQYSSSYERTCSAKFGSNEANIRTATTNHSIWTNILWPMNSLLHRGSKSRVPLSRKCISCVPKCLLHVLWYTDTTRRLTFSPLDNMEGNPLERERYHRHLSRTTRTRQQRRRRTSNTRFDTTAVRFVLSSLVHNCYTWNLTAGRN